MRQIYIYCDGGFGNRFNALVSGLAIAEQMGLRPAVVWPLNNWCGAPYAELFQEARDVLDRELITFVAQKEQLQFLMVEDHLKIGVAWQSPMLMSSWGELSNYLGSSVADIFYYTALIPPFITLEQVKAEVAKVPFHAAIVASAERFMMERSLRTFYGLQIRKTDFGANGADDESLFGLVAQRPDATFFVCSDEKSVEDRFRSLPNVVALDKNAYVEKRIESGWLGHTIDHSGRSYASNVNRGKQSVIDALVDLLILSHSQVVRTSNSTFLNVALLLQASRAETLDRLMHRDRQVISMEITTQDEILNLLNLIRPRHLVSDRKVRIGAESDGGYVMPSSSLDSNLVISIGIGKEVSFDVELAGRGARIYQFDHTIDKTPVDHSNIRFFRKAWGPSDDATQISLKTMVSIIDWGEARHPILKFDAEGAEWASLEASDSSDLELFEVITGEFHEFHRLIERNYFSLVQSVLRKLEQTHFPIHIHGNNATGMRLILGIPIPPLLEITFVRKSSAVFGGHSTEPIPGPLDRPNLPGLPDLCLRPF